MGSGAKVKIENARQVIRRLENHGFEIVRSRGSHQQLLCTHPNGCHHLVTVAIHGGKDIETRDIKSIIRQSGMTLTDFYA